MRGSDEANNCVDKTFESSKWRLEGSRYEYRTIADKTGEKLEHKSCM